jgi:hypothetical protein
MVGGNRIGSRRRRRIGSPEGRTAEKMSGHATNTNPLRIATRLAAVAVAYQISKELRPLTGKLLIRLALRRAGELTAGWRPNL